MTKGISSSRKDRRFRAMVHELTALSPRDLGELGIARSQINHLAHEVSMIEQIQTRRAIIALGAVFGLIALWFLSPAL